LPQADTLATSRIANAARAGRSVTILIMTQRPRRRASKL
jgi:hypothetical protein